MIWKATSVELDGEGGREGHTLVSVEAPPDAPRAPVVANLVLDRSGSMRGAPLAAAVEAAQQFVEQAAPDDFLGLVAFDGVPEQRVPLVAMDERGKRRISDALSALDAGRGTALHQAIEVAAASMGRLLVPGRTPKLLVLTDGEPSIGPEAPPVFSELGKKVADSGIRIHALGLGAHYVPEILAALTAPSSNGYEHVDGPDGLAVAMGSVFAQVFGEVGSDLAIRIAPSGFQSLLCRHAYPTRADGDALIVSLGGLSRGHVRRVLLSGALKDPTWSVAVTGQHAERGDTRHQSVSVERVWPAAEAGVLVRGVGLELDLVNAESLAWLSLARRDAARAEALFEDASAALRQLIALAPAEIPVRRHLERLGDLRHVIDKNDGEIPMLIRRARSTHAGTHMSQVIELASRRPKR